MYATGGFVCFLFRPMGRATVFFFCGLPAPQVALGLVHVQYFAHHSRQRWVDLP
jgi:hypothetical protein